MPARAMDISWYCDQHERTSRGTKAPATIAYSGTKYSLGRNRIPASALFLSMSMQASESLRAVHGDPSGSRAALVVVSASASADVFLEHVFSNKERRLSQPPLDTSLSWNPSAQHKQLPMTLRIG